MRRRRRRGSSEMDCDEDEKQRHMRKRAENRRRLALLLQEAYEDLTAEEVQRLLEEAQRVKRKQVRYGLMHARSGRTLQVEPLNFPT